MHEHGETRRNRVTVLTRYSKLVKSMNAASTEIDVAQLMSAIRESALRKHGDLDIHTRHEQIPSGLQAHIQRIKDREQTPEQLNEREQLSLSPEFKRHPNDIYHVNDLLKYHDRDFVRNAYRAILNREPDEAGYLYNLKLLQSGDFNKIDILASLRYSDEGKFNGVNVSGLRLPATIRALERVPVFGYLLQLVLALVRLPLMVRSQRQFQGYIVAQQLAVADYVNDVNHNRRVTTNEFHRHRYTVENQLRTLETLVQRVGTEEEKLKHAEANLLQLNDRLASMSETLSRTREQIRRLSSGVQSGGRSLGAECRTSDELREWDDLYSAFEDQFRGSAEEVEERLRFYLPFLEELNPDSKILDLGSGRGDWLKLLRKEGFRASGVEVNEVFAEDSCKQGLEVVHEDMMVHLGRQPDNSLDLVTAFHLIEHLDSEKLFRLLDEIKRILKPGGRVFMETPSSENLVVAACNFYADPTHYRPVNPHTLMFVLRQKGFIDLGLQFLHPVDGSPFKECEGAEQLNMWFYGPRDVAVTARKAR